MLHDSSSLDTEFSLTAAYIVYVHALYSTYNVLIK